MDQNEIEEAVERIVNEKNKARERINWYLYQDVARELGFQYIEQYNTSSSAGDWSILVSRDREVWYMMHQFSGYRGYEYTFNERCYYGTFEQVCDLLTVELEYDLTGACEVEEPHMEEQHAKD